MSRGRSRYVIEHCGLRFRVPPPPDETDERILYLGDIADGVALEVMAVELSDDALYVIHDAATREVPRPVRGGEEVATLKTRAGTRLTRRRVQDLASEAERGYDLARARRERVRGGRPSLGEGVSPQISYRVAGALYAKARAKAKAQGRTVSEIARQALEEYISR